MRLNKNPHNIIYWWPSVETCARGATVQRGSRHALVTACPGLNSPESLPVFKISLMIYILWEDFSFQLICYLRLSCVTSYPQALWHLCHCCGTSSCTFVRVQQYLCPTTNVMYLTVVTLCVICCFLLDVTCVFQLHCSVTASWIGMNKELQADWRAICSFVRSTHYLWGAAQIYKGLFAGDCSKNPWYHLTFSPKSICLRHQRKAQRDAIKSFIKAVRACNGVGWNEILWVDSISWEGQFWDFIGFSLLPCLL